MIPLVTRAGPENQPAPNSVPSPALAKVAQLKAQAAVKTAAAAQQPLQPAIETEFRLPSAIQRLTTLPPLTEKVNQMVAVLKSQPLCASLREGVLEAICSAVLETKDACHYKKNTEINPNARLPQSFFVFREGDRAWAAITKKQFLGEGSSTIAKVFAVIPFIDGKPLPALNMALRRTRMDQEHAENRIRTCMRNVNLLGKVDGKYLVLPEVTSAYRNNKGVKTLLQLAPLADGDLEVQLKNNSCSLNFWRLFHNLVMAIHSVDKAGLIYRDLKPANIFIVGLMAKLGDFDVSILKSECKNAGTPAWLPPEALGFHFKMRRLQNELGIPFEALNGPKVDVFCIGMILDAWYHRSSECGRGAMGTYLAKYAEKEDLCQATKIAAAQFRKSILAELKRLRDAGTPHFTDEPKEFNELIEKLCYEPRKAPSVLSKLVDKYCEAAEANYKYREERTSALTALENYYIDQFRREKRVRKPCNWKDPLDIIATLIRIDSKERPSIQELYNVVTQMTIP